MTMQANPHKQYQDMLKMGRRRPMASRRQPVQDNPSVVVKLSEGAVALSEVQGLQKLSPEERAERVRFLKKAIQEGRYRVDSFLIAEALMEGEKALERLSKGLDEETDEAPEAAKDSGGSVMWDDDGEEEFSEEALDAELRLLEPASEDVEEPVTD